MDNIIDYNNVLTKKCSTYQLTRVTPYILVMYFVNIKGITILWNLWWRGKWRQDIILNIHYCTLLVRRN